MGLENQGISEVLSKLEVRRNTMVGIANKACSECGRMEMNSDAHNDLRIALRKVEFIIWGLASNNSGGLMGDEDQSGLCYILNDVRASMEAALKCEFYVENDLE